MKNKEYLINYKFIFLILILLLSILDIYADMCESDFANLCWDNYEESLHFRVFYGPNKVPAFYILY